MPNSVPKPKHIPPVTMTVGSLMSRPMAEVQNYETEVLPLLRLCGEYRAGFIEMLDQVPGQFFAVANFNLLGLEPEWCRARLNLFDMKVAQLLLGRKWSRKPESERPNWVAVPEHATYLHYNMVWSVPVQHQESFYVNAPVLWRETVPSGQFHLQVIGEGAKEASACRGYSGKTFHPRWTLDNMVTSRELRRKLN